MIQIIPAAQRSPSFGERISQGIGQALESGSQMYSENQKKEALKSLGIDPAVLDLPQQGQAAYFKSKFAPEKQLNSLQETQQRLAEERLKALQGQQSLSQRIFGGEEQQQDLSEPGMQQQKTSGLDLSTIPEEKLKQGAAFAGQPGPEGVMGAMFKGELDRREKLGKENFEREKLERKEAFEVTKPLMLELQESRKNIPLQEQAIEDIKNASPEVGTRDYIADLTGFEPLRTAEGAKLKTAIKDFFLSDLTRVGARPNQWVEQQLADALPKIGRSPEANLIVAEGMQFKVDLAKKRIELLDQLSEQDIKKHTFVKSDVDSRANQLLKPYVEQRKKELIDNITKIKSAHKVEKGFTRMQNPETKETFDILNKNVNAAEKDGWIPL